MCSAALLQPHHHFIELAESDESMETMTKRRKAQRELRSKKTGEEAASWEEEPEKTNLNVQ